MTELRKGFTTGSCAAAAAKAASYMLLTGARKEKISIITPKGIEYIADVTDITKGEDLYPAALLKMEEMILMLQPVHILLLPFPTLKEKTL